MRARSAVTAVRYPGKIDYTVAISGLDGATPRVNHYRATSDPDDGRIVVAPISREEAASPRPVPHGFNASVTATLYGILSITIPVGRPPQSTDLIGVPLLAPSYMFGLSYQRQTQSGDGDDADTKIPVIAVVSTNTRDYGVTLVDTPLVDDVACYHLALTPLRKPKDNRLRELWVGESDYLPRKAVVAGNFTLAPLGDVPWTIDFSVAGTTPFIRRESAGATLHLAHRKVVKDATIAFENVREGGAATIYDRPLIAPEPTDTTLTEPAP